MAVNWSRVIQVLRIAGMAVVVSVAFMSILALVLWDVWAGALTMSAMFGDHSDKWAILVSLATTGVLLVLFYAARAKNKVIFLLALVPFVLDEYFDAMAADVLRFGAPVVLASLPVSEHGVTIALRVLFAVLSSVGELLGVYMILGGGRVLADIVSDVSRGEQAQPASVPRAQPPRSPARKCAVAGCEMTALNGSRYCRLHYTGAMYGDYGRGGA